MRNLTAAIRQEKTQTAATRYRKAVPAVKGAVQAVLLRPEVAEAWGWIIARLGMDIAGDLPPESRLVESIGQSSDIVNLIERVGSRIALPDGFLAAAWTPAPKTEFWVSHVTGEPLPNPWVTGDKEDQAFVRLNLGEDFANELEIAARGGRSYREELERRDEARLAELAKNWPATRPNPFASRPAEYDKPAIDWTVWSTSERRKIEKENPPLARWLKKIAEPQAANPFDSMSFNRTKQLAILKADPGFGQLLERTAVWKKDQLAYEAEEAERAAIAARAQAEEARQRAGRR